MTRLGAEDGGMRTGSGRPHTIRRSADGPVVSDQGDQGAAIGVELFVMPHESLDDPRHVHQGDVRATAFARMGALELLACLFRDAAARDEQSGLPCTRLWTNFRTSLALSTAPGRCRMSTRMRGSLKLNPSGDATTLRGRSGPAGVTQMRKPMPPRTPYTSFEKSEGERLWT